ncbi:MAG: molybdenum cofactor biosynthesis protein MoaE [Candidatus Poseidoniaceae archaeon]|jgi:molybdopterin synthase catalytic subunit|nr:molybdenum cofactor biosynthesis protein MoaE [Candidatus Poseidoniaceae archaeon]
MSGHILIENAIEKINADQLKSKMNLEGCGAVVSFLGITRAKNEDTNVIQLEFDAWLDKLPSVLHRLAEQAIEKFGIISVAMAHRVGIVKANEDIVAIHVGSAHRKAAFKACEWLIDELKSQAPLWKKEVTDAGEEWKAGLG